MLKSINYFFQFLLIIFFFLIGRIVGIKLSRKIFSNLFFYLGPLFKSKSLFEKNIKFFSKNLSDEEIKKIYSSMWKNYGMTFIEYIYLDYFKKNNSHIHIKEKTNLLAVNNKKPVIFVSGHFANFELMSMEITKKNIKLATIYRPLNNIFLNPLMEYLRKKFVCKNQIKKGISGVRDTIEHIKNNHSIALMIDQRVSEGEKLNFFDHTALTTTLPAQLALKYNLNIIPVFIERKHDNKFYLEFYEEIQTNNFKDKTELTNKLNNILESMIIRNPYQWIWTHNRWKQ